MTDANTGLFEEALSARQKLAARLLENAVLRGRLANAYLLTGDGNEDKWELSRSIASFLNCTNKKSMIDMSGFCKVGAKALLDTRQNCQICQSCQSCQWISRNEHPQAWLTLACDTKKSGIISVESARTLACKLTKTSQFTRVVVIDSASADTFHRPAANALLKTIEEPKAGVLFMLFSANVDEVIPTVVSRCQIVPMTTNLPVATETPALKPSSKDLSTVLNCLEFSAQLQELTGKSPDSTKQIDKVLDDMVRWEVRSWQEHALSNKYVSGYVKELMSLSEATKLKLNHYVAVKPAIDSFILSWHKLRIEVEAKVS